MCVHFTNSCQLHCVEPFLNAGNGSSLYLGSQGESSTPEPKAYSEEVCHENGLSYSLSDSDTEHLSSSLEAEHR